MLLYNYLCYEVAGQRRFRPDKFMDLFDQFHEDGRRWKTGRRVDQYCKPAAKSRDAGGVVEEIRNPDANLTCFQASLVNEESGKSSNHLDSLQPVTVSTQFREQELVLDRTRTLCVPTVEGEVANPAEAVAELESRLNHFTCYQADFDEIKPSKIAETVTVEDELFGEGAVNVNREQLVCNPTTKVRDEEVTEIIPVEGLDHLTCFKLDGEKIRTTKTVTISNQFVQNVTLEVTDKAKWFCEASSKEHLLSQCNGNTNARVYFPPGSEINDIVGLRYAFNVAANTQSGLDLKILFGFMRFYGTGGPETYLLESNLYASRLSYSDQVCTIWPLLGTPTGSEASLRVAVPDFNELGKTGAKTFDPIVFPRQSYKIDDGPIDKTDMISQLNLNGITGEVEIVRGSTVVDKTGWKCSGNLDASTYQQWDVTVTIGAMQYPLAFALPLDNAAFFTAGEVINYVTEFFALSGQFQVFLWDHEIMSQHSGTWQPVEQWRVDNHCGDLNQYGVRVAEFAGNRAIEISNVGADDYLGAGSVFSLDAN